MFNIKSGSPPRYNAFTGIRFRQERIFDRQLIRRLCDSEDIRSTNILSRWSVRVEQTTDRRLWSAIYFIFQIQSQNSSVQNSLRLKD